MQKFQLGLTYANNVKAFMQLCHGVRVAPHTYFQLPKVRHTTRALILEMAPNFFL
jgi:hypothetical protein